MRQAQRILSAALASILAIGTVLVLLPQNARAANDPSLVISQFKITSSNGQFVTLYNPTNNVINLAKFQLQYFNSYDLAKATSNRQISLSGGLLPHGYYTISDDRLSMCYKMTVDSVSLGFSSTSGLIQVVELSQLSNFGAINPQLHDFVGWSKTATVGAQVLPASIDRWLQRRPIDSSGKPDIRAPGSGSWAGVSNNPNDDCTYIVDGSVVPVNGYGESSLLPAGPPPVTVVDYSVNPAVASVLTDGLPEADRGLKMPVINELLPNPTGTGNDATDEFFELYNPNQVEFDLSGFTIQAGLTTFYNYKFEPGEMIPPMSFKAYYSATSGLSLSNTKGQVRLLDPVGNLLNQSSAYENAKDGQSWALANGNWLWSKDVTPGRQNVIQTVVPTASSANKSSKNATIKPKTTKAVKAKKATTKKLPKTSKSKNTYPSEAFINVSDKRSVNGLFLAITITAAILYVAYEYRHEISNRYHRFRSNRQPGS